MAVYVDAIQVWPEEAIKEAARRFGNRWCHCWADSTSELIQFGTLAGWSAGWLQRDRLGGHFDLVPSQRRHAVRLGAIESTLRERWQETRTRNP